MMDKATEDAFDEIRLALKFADEDEDGDVKDQIRSRLFNLYLLAGGQAR